MIYREAGQLKTSYAADQAIFPLRQDRIWLALGLLIAFVAVPLLASEYVITSLLIPFLILALTAIGLNILTGYCGQLSLGTGGFMAVGAFAGFKITAVFPWIDIGIVFLLAGLVTALVRVLFGLPSLRIKGFYLAVATLAAQFFLIWLFTKVAWFSNYAPSRVIVAPPRSIFGVDVTGIGATYTARYLFILGFVAVLALAAKNLVRGR